MERRFTSQAQYLTLKKVYMDLAAFQADVELLSTACDMLGSRVLGVQFVDQVAVEYLPTAILPIPNRMKQRGGLPGFTIF